MRETVKTDDPSLVRDKDTNAIINIDNAGFETFMKERERILRLDEVSTEVISLKQDMTQIKQMLQQLLNGKTNG
jgi:hypothetical protein